MVETIQTTEEVGVCDSHPDDVTAEDITVKIREQSDDTGPVFVDWYSEEVIQQNVQVRGSKRESVGGFALRVVIDQLPVPDTIEGSWKLDVSVRQVREKRAATCPECGSDLHETFTAKTGCSDCDFYPGGSPTVPDSGEKFQW